MRAEAAQSAARSRHGSKLPLTVSSPAMRRVPEVVTVEAQQRRPPTRVALKVASADEAYHRGARHLVYIAHEYHVIVAPTSAEEAVEKALTLIVFACPREYRSVERRFHPYVHHLARKSRQSRSPRHTHV